MKTIPLPPISTKSPKAKPHLPADPQASIWNRELRLGPMLSMKDRQLFYQQLAILLDSGLGIIDCLEVMISQYRKKHLKALLQSLIDGLQEGFALSEVFLEKKAFFSEFEVHSLRAGEQSGQMTTVLTSLAEMYEKRIRLKRKLAQAMTYPIAVIGVAGLVLAFMLTFVVPMFEDIFQRFDAELPVLTRWVMAASTALRTHSLWLLGVSVGLVMLGIKLRKLPRMRQGWSTFLLKIPLLGKAMLKLQLARFCHSFALLLTAKVHLDQALDLMTQLCRFYPLQMATQEIRTAVIEGESLYDAVASQPIFPAFFVQIIRVGEASARLGEMLETMGENLEEESETAVQQLTQLIEPVLIIALGLMVALILGAMYLPMFELGKAVG